MKLFWDLDFFKVFREVLNHDELTQLRYRNEARLNLAKRSGHNVFRG